MSIRTILFLLVLIISGDQVFSQKSKSYCNDSKVTVKMLKTKDGTTLFGDLINSNDTMLTLNTNSLGVINIPADQVKSIKDVICSRIKDGDYWFDDPGSNFYMIAPSSFNLEKGSFYYRNTFLFINTFGYSFTNYFTLNAGFDFITLFQENYSGTAHPDFLLMPQLNFSVIRNVRAGGGFIYIRDKKNFLENNAEMPFLNFAYGNSDRNIGISGGYNIVGNSRPFYIVNGLYRVANRLALEGEYFRLPQAKPGNFFNYGVKFISRNISLDFGFIYSTNIANIIPIGMPFVSFTLSK